MLRLTKDPVHVDGEWNKFLGKLDYGFTCIFAIEVLLKVSCIFAIEVSCIFAIEVLLNFKLKVSCLYYIMNYN